MITLKSFSYQAEFEPAKFLKLNSFQRDGFEALSPAAPSRAVAPYLSLPHYLENRGNTLDELLATERWEIVFQNDHHLKAQLKSKQTFLQSLEAECSATVDQQGLHLKFSMISDYDSLIGYRFCFRAKKVLTRTPKENPQAIASTGVHTYTPYPDPTRCSILISNPEAEFELSYRSQCQENSWIYEKPEGKDFISISPVSAKLPYTPILSVSAIEMTLT